ncbi:hypothetical protein NQ318_018672 [Aromia moschata]|uniref:MADF domain-containing protein n=1 Tax=Aromia moschata TaxID=1265417 RepID=A0AAV8ZIH3_9CUCU|nr:hypothetical protein NQ318_018672 [Aromia moschata]
MIQAPLPALGWVHTVRISGEDYPFRPNSPAGRNVWTRLLLQLRRTAQAARPFQIFERPPEQSAVTEPLSSRVEGATRGLKAAMAVVDALSLFVVVMSKTKNRSAKEVVLEDFIEIYRSEPCLWQVKNKYYHDRNKKEAAYAKLVSKLREIEADAARDAVIKRINNLRSAVRKEKKKVDSSKKSGTSPDAIYKPILWYYDLFTFLGDQETPVSSTSNLDDTGNDTLITVSCF